MSSGRSSDTVLCSAGGLLRHVRHHDDGSAPEDGRPCGERQRDIHCGQHLLEAAELSGMMREMGGPMSRARRLGRRGVNSKRDAPGSEPGNSLGGPDGVA